MTKKQIYDTAYKKKHARHDRRMKYLYNRTANGKYRVMKGHAKLYNVPLTISLEEFKELISKPCYYCGGKLPEAGSGVDRINSKLGYTIKNVKPCCWVCNRAKGAFTQDEFRKWVKQIHKYWIGDLHDSALHQSHRWIDGLGREIMDNGKSSCRATALTVS
jgi:hypothetical protein